MSHAVLREIVDGRKLRFDVEVTEGSARSGSAPTSAASSASTSSARPPPRLWTGRAAAERPHPRGRAARRVPERAGDDRHRGEGAADRSALGDRVKRMEVTSFVRPDVIPQLADAAQVLMAVAAARGGRLLGPDPERARPGAGAGASRPLRRGQRLPLRLGDPQPAQRQPLDRGVACGAGGDAGERRRGGAAPRGRDCDLVRLSLRGPGAARAGLRDRRTARRGGLRGGRLRRHHRDGQPAPGPRVLRRRPRASARASS